MTDEEVFEAAAKNAAEIVRLEMQVDKLKALMDTLIFETKGWLPHEFAWGEFRSDNERLTPETRTRLAFLESIRRLADKV